MRSRAREKAPLNLSYMHTVPSEARVFRPGVPELRTTRSIASRECEHRRAMRLVVLRTFLTLVRDESPDPPYSRARSAPAELHYTDSHRPSGGDAAAGPASSEPRKKKPAKGGSTAVDALSLIHI